MRPGTLAHVPSMNDLVRQHTALDDTDLEWLHLLVSEWQLLSDLSFADLVLWVPTRDGTRYVSVAQMRPNTGPTSYQDDMVGHLVPRGRRPLLDAALDEGRIVREGDPEWREEVPVRVESIPVRREGRVLGVIARNTNLLTVRTPSRLELTYLQSASDLAQMIAAGSFPFPGQQVDMDASPRVGDGLIRLDADGIVQYASPNALSAYHRLGLASDLVGHHLGRTTAELAPSRGPVDEALVKLASGWAPREFEVEGDDGVIQLRAIPLKPKGARIGSLVLLRDVTELRRRERELITKDATIREIHHRVKNNLQTVAALLRLQARRMDSEQGREALEEAVRRVGSIAIVHETLSQNLDERVEFDEIADRVLAMVAEISPGQGHRPPHRPLRHPRRGGRHPAVHGAHRGAAERAGARLRTGGDGHGRGLRGARRHPTEGRLLITVQDDGRGLPEGFDPQRAGNLGLQIVRTLVEGELGGTFDMVPGARARHPGGPRPPGAARRSSRGCAAGPNSSEPRTAVDGPGSLAHACASGVLRAATRGAGLRAYARVRAARCGSVAVGVRRQALALRARLRAARRFIARRSSSLRPPQTPESWPDSSAHCRHCSMTGQRRQTALASSICSSAGPVLPMGKKSSGSSSRQTAL